MSRAPYKYLDYYTFEDADLFFGREEETQRMVGEILSTRLLVLFSPSGSGKTSLINAGVRPQLENMGYQTIYTRLETEPISSVCNAVASALEIPCDGNIQSLYEFLQAVTSRIEKPMVIFLDQFEEFFTVFREQRDKRKEFIDQLAKIKYDDHLPVFVVLSLREDYFVNLHEFREAIPSIFQNNANLRLEPFTDEEARRAIVNPLQAERIDASIEADLVNELINDLKDSQPGIEPIKLQIVCHTLWEKKVKGADQIRLSDYQACEGADAILSHHVHNLLNKIPKRQHGFMVRIFEALKTEDDTKRFRSFSELKKELKIKKPERLAKMLDKFADLHLLRYEEKEQTKWYEFKHDYLVGEITRWIKQRKEQLVKKRFRYAIAPGIILALVLLIWAIIEYNRFEARFTDWVYAEQQQEVFVQRKFNPFNFRVTTGILYDDLKGHETRNLIKNGLTISNWDKKNWSQLAKQITNVRCGALLYKIGQHEAGIDSLMNALRGEEWEICNQASKELEHLGKVDEKIQSTLLEALRNKKLYVRFGAANALINIGKADYRIIDILIETLKDEDSYARAEAASSLGKLGSNDDRVISVLIEALKDEEYEVRDQAANALIKLIKVNDWVVNALIETLKDEKSDVRYQAAYVLRKLGEGNDRIIAALIAALKSENSYARYEAAMILVNLEKVDNMIIDILLSELNSEDWEIRSRTVRALPSVGKLDDRVIAALKAAMDDKDSDVRFDAVYTLIKIDKGGEWGINTLLSALNDDKNWNVRHKAMYALEDLGKADNRVTIALIDKLKDQRDEYFRDRAAGALINIGKADNKVIPVLLLAMEDKNSYVRFEAARVLVNLGKIDDRIITIFSSALEHKDSDVRSKAIIVLVKLSKEKDGIIYILDEALKNKDWRVSFKASIALINLGKADHRIINTLMAALKDESSYVSSEAAHALGNFFKFRTKEELLQLLKHHLSGFRKIGAYALTMQDSISQEILEEINRLKDNDRRPWVRLGAWEAYELIQERLTYEKAANQFIHKADSLFQIDKFWNAGDQYQSAFDQLTKIIRIDSLKIARTKFQQARCTAKMKRLVPTLDHLEIAFQYNKAWIDTLRAELAQKESEWEFMKENWYLNEVLLKNSKPQITNHK